MENQKKDVFPEQHQNRHPGKESEMNPVHVYENMNYSLISAAEYSGEV